MDPRDGGRLATTTNPKFEVQKRRYQNKTNKRPAATRPEKITFSGLTEDLNDHIYDVGTIFQANQFTATTKDLENYAGCKCKDIQDIKISIESQKDVVTQIPSLREYTDKDVDKLLLGNISTLKSITLNSTKRTR